MAVLDVDVPSCIIMGNEKIGKTVVTVDREAFRKAAIPLHNDASAGAGWSRAEYDALQALK